VAVEGQPAFSLPMVAAMVVKRVTLTRHMMNYQFSFSTAMMRQSRLAAVHSVFEKMTRMPFSRLAMTCHPSTDFSWAIAAAAVRGAAAVGGDVDGVAHYASRLCIPSFFVAKDTISPLCFLAMIFEVDQVPSPLRQ
jgi:hypothetical protein